MDNRKIILAVAFDEENDKYIVDIPAGSNVAEAAFGVAVVIKCLVKDGIIDKPEVFTDAILKYLNDPQYEEVK